MSVQLFANIKSSICRFDMPPSHPTATLLVCWVGWLVWGAVWLESRPACRKAITAPGGLCVEGEVGMFICESVS